MERALVAVSRSVTRDLLLDIHGMNVSRAACGSGLALMAHILGFSCLQSQASTPREPRD